MTTCSPSTIDHCVKSGYNYVDILRFIIGSVMFTENLLTIVLVCRFTNLQTKTNVILSSLALVDLITGLILVLNPILWTNAYSEHMCHQVYVFNSMLLLISGFHLVVVTLDRYLAILYPLYYHTYFNKYVLSCCLIISWCVPAIVNWTLFIFFKDQKLDYCNCYMVLLPSSFNYTFICIFMAFTVIMIIMYVIIFGQIRKQQRQIQDQTLGNSGRIKSDFKAAKTLIVTVVCFLICWIPGMICILISLQYEKNDIPMFFKQNLAYFETLAALNSGMNPIIYIIRMKSFRVAYFKLFHCDICLKLNTD